MAFVRARASAVLVAVAVTMVPAASAWACFPLPVLSVQPRASGPVGAGVTVQGTDFGEGVATELRWNAIDGPLLGRGSTGSFSVPVTIPQADDGVYAIVALSRRVDATVGAKAVTSFQVSSGPSSSTPVGSSSATAASGSDHHRPSSTSSGRSAAATAGLALLGGALVAAGGLGGALFAGRRRARRAGLTPADATD